MVDSKLFERATAFSDAALTFIDDDGYPFSVPVTFEIDAEKQLIRVSKPANLTRPETREVGIIFNYVKALEAGGYTDRRYVVFWGRLKDEGKACVLNPVKGYSWDEAEVPFFQYSEMRNKRARSYLDQLREKPWLSTPWLILRTFRLPFVIATILPVVLGGAVAYRAGFFDWPLLVLTLLGALLIHLGVNTANDYFDARSGADDVNTTPTPFSGGSRVIQYGLLPAPVILSLSTAAYVGGCAIGLYLALTRGWVILLLGLVGLVVSYGYTAPPLKFVYRGFGEFAVTVGFGPLLVLGSYFVQARSLSWEAFLVSIPVGLLVMLILYVNEIPDRTWDDEASKRTIVTRVREGLVTSGFTISIVAVYSVLVLGVVGRLFPLTVLAGLLTIPLALKVRRLIQGNLSNPYGLMPAMSMNIKLFAFTTILVLVGYGVSFFLHF